MYITHIYYIYKYILNICISHTYKTKLEEIVNLRGKSRGPGRIWREGRNYVNIVLMWQFQRKNIK